MLNGNGFAKTQLRQVFFAIWKTMANGEPNPKIGVQVLRTEAAMPA